MEAYFIIYISILSAGIACAIYRWSKLSQASRLAALLLIFTLISESTAQILYMFSIRNYWVYHIFIPAQFFLITGAFNVELQNKLLRWAQYGFAVISLSLSITSEGYQKFPSHQHSISSFFVILWSLLFLKALLQQAEEYSFKQYPLFWIASGWLLFTTLTFLNFGIFSSLIKVDNETFQHVVRNIRIGSNYFLYTCYIIALLTPQRELKR